MHTSSAHRTFPALIKFDFVLLKIVFNVSSTNSEQSKLCNVLELVDNFGFLISFFFDKFICQVQLGLSCSFLNYIVS